MKTARSALLRAVLFAAAAAVLGGCASLYGPQAPTPAGLPRVKPRALRAEAVVELRRSIPVMGRAVVLVESPDKFRIEVSGPFNQADALFVSDGKRLFVFNGRRAEVYDWADPSMPYPFGAEEAVSFLMGGSGAPAWGGDGKGYTVTKDADGRVKEVVKLKGGAEALRVALSDYRSVAGAQIPFHISIDGRERLTIIYSDVEIDPEIGPGAFSIPRLGR